MICKALPDDRRCPPLAWRSEVKRDRRVQRKHRGCGRNEGCQHRVHQRVDNLADVLDGRDDQHRQPSMTNCRTASVQPDDGETTQGGPNDHQQSRLIGRGDGRGFVQIDNLQSGEPADAKGAKEFRPDMRDDRDCHRVDGRTPNATNNGATTAIGVPNPSMPWRKRSEHSAESNDDKQLVAVHASDALSQRVLAAGLIHDLIEKQSGPDDQEDEHSIPHAFGTGDGKCLQRRPEDKKATAAAMKIPAAPAC